MKPKHKPQNTQNQPWIPKAEVAPEIESHGINKAGSFGDSESSSSTSFRGLGGMSLGTSPEGSSQPASQLHYYSRRVYQTGICIGTNLEAEAQGLLLGLQNCLRRHHQEVIIDVDSQGLVHLVTGLAVIPWHLDVAIRKIWFLLQQGNFLHHHRLRKANSVAETLANLGSSSSSCNIYFLQADVPSCIQGLIRLDLVGFLYI
ncbi:hypothetical protein ACH5RR_021374 [Cinchona calisaya]|uniref:RNase H type-1 domain-containing protein n=1 Tax=Cinchona calisaya TaxID=153742 RepID=A0ABD2ZKD5_9GENT